MQVKLISHTYNPIKTMAIAGSNCYDSMPSDSIVNHCYNVGHHSILEFADFHFKISGVSRALTHQLVRKRIASYAQRSQRYVREDGNKVVYPPSVLKSDKSAEIFNNAISVISGAYEELVNLGVPIEDARYILPNAQETVIDVKMNLRSLIEFCNERLCNRSQWEIRRLAELMKKEIENNVSPHLALMLKPKCEKHDMPFCPESKKDCCGRHKTLTNLIFSV